MTTDKEKAVEYKDRGNKAFAAHDWPTAIELYSNAILLDDKNPVFWSNRAQVNLYSYRVLPAIGVA
jgi:serine/threonine-protein phosphatase 5